MLFKITWCQIFPRLVAYSSIYLPLSSENDSHLPCRRTLAPGTGVMQDAQFILLALWKVWCRPGAWTVWKWGPGPLHWPLFSEVCIQRKHIQYFELGRTEIQISTRAYIMRWALLCLVYTFHGCSIWPMSRRRASLEEGDISKGVE